MLFRSPGDYIFTEVSAPEGFIIDTTPLPFSIEAEVEGEPVLITIGDVVNYQGEILLTKVDENENLLEGAVFELRDAVGNLLRDDLISDEEGIVTVDRLAPGDYVLREIKAPTGYILNTTPIAFTIAEGMAGQPDILSLGHFTNYQGSGGVMKVDENGNPLADAEFSVFDADGNAVLTGLVSDEEGRIVIEDLAPGKYTLVETKAPAGYVLTEEVYSFEVAAEAEGKPVEFLLTVTNALEPVEPGDPEKPVDPEEPSEPEDSETPSDPEDPDLPGTGEAPIYTALALSLITVGLGISFYRRRRFSE